MAFPPFNPPRSSQGNEQSTPIYNGNCIVTAKGQYHYLPPSATYEGFLGSMIFYRGLYEWIPVDIAPATVTRAIPGDGQISFMDGYGSLVAVHFLPPTTPAALETLTFPHELMSESTYQTSVPSNPNEAISGRYRSVPNTSSALATIPPPNDPSVSRLPVLSHTPKLFPSVVGSHSYQIIEGDIEDSEADKYIIPTGSKSFKCIAPYLHIETVQRDLAQDQNNGQDSFEGSLSKRAKVSLH
ncbi:hypothetical protein JB92DRAFT_3109973 [Gautieria morchelliformis]|nr:hypothetical protein JB92DRAFT_3109973 [Gautieria morchelliformis]